MFTSIKAFVSNANTSVKQEKPYLSAILIEFPIIVPINLKLFKFERLIYQFKLDTTLSTVYMYLSSVVSSH